VSLLRRLGLTSPAPSKPSTAPPALTPRFGLAPVGWSADLARVIALPRRDLSKSYTEEELSRLEDSLRLPSSEVKCVCASQGRACPTSLRPIQRLALMEFSRSNGGVASIGAGHGKELLFLLLAMVVPNCRVAVLLIPADLKAQVLERDWNYYGGHWRLPNLVGGRWFRPGVPALHIITYSALSAQSAADLLPRIKPDLILANEAQNLQNPKGPRWMRLERWFEQAPSTRFIPGSGTIAKRGYDNCAHLFARALGDGSPLPKERHTVKEWDSALAPGPSSRHPAPSRGSAGRGRTLGMRWRVGATRPSAS
jgi:hypothetical protein